MTQSQDLNNAEIMKNPEQIIEYPELGIKIYAALNTDKDKLYDNVKTSIARGHEQVWSWKEQDTVAAIVGGGASLLDTIEELRGTQEHGAKVIALANTAHVLVENGIKPNACVLLDATPNNASFIVDDLDVPYFVASQCDPSVFDKLEKLGRKIYIWHAVNDVDEFEVISEAYEKWIPIQGGNTIMLRAMRLFNVLGYHRFDVFGFDSCMYDDQHHAYEQPKADGDKAVKIGCNGREFEVTGWMISQAMEFIKTVKAFGQNWQMRVHGDGLIEHLIRTGGR